MPAEHQDSNLPSVRPASAPVELANSRLLRRAVAALDELSTVSLQVRKLIASGSSLFVLSQFYDASWQADVRDNTVWKQNRRLILFEFDPTGIFIQALELPLLELSEYGYDQVGSRLNLGVTIRAEFIYFRETLCLRRTLLVVQIDYVFSRTGQLLAVWCNHDCLDSLRQWSAPLVPTITRFRPEWIDVATGSTSEWIDGKRFVTVIPSHENPVLLPPDPSDDDYDGPPMYGYAFDYDILHQDVLSLAKHICSPGPKENHEGNVSRSYPRTRVTFPVAAALFADGGYTHLWDGATCDDRSIWFLMNEPPGSVRNISVSWRSSVLWRMEIFDGQTDVQEFSLPHPYELIRSGRLEIHNSLDGNWTPTDQDFDTMFSTAPLEEPQRYYHLEYRLTFSHGDHVIVKVQGGVSEGKSLETVASFHEELLLCKIVEGQLTIDCQINPETVDTNHLIRQWNSFSDLDEALEEPPSQLLKHLALGQSGLYSIVQYGAHKNTIVVTDFDTRTVTWFRAEVPLTELKALELM